MLLDVLPSDRTLLWMVLPRSLVSSLGMGADRSSPACVERPCSDCAYVPRAARLPNPFLLLNCGEQPLSILVSHECPYFAGLGRRLLAAFDEIARFSSLLRQGDGVVTGTPAKPDRRVVRRIFDPSLPDICLFEHHILNMIGNVEAGLFGQGGAEIRQHFRCDESPKSCQVLVAPGRLNIGQQLLKGRLVGGGDFADHRRGLEGRGGRFL